MNPRSFVSCILTVIFLAACAATVGPMSPSEINLIPMYGYPERQRTAEEKKADEEFIASHTSGQSRAQSSKKFADMALHYELIVRMYDNAMRAYNAAWLMNPNNYVPYWGFGSLLSKSKPAEASAYLEKALSLVDNENDAKPYIMRATAASYSLQAQLEKDPIKKNGFYKKANALYSESANLTPNNAFGYTAWGNSLYSEGDYTKSWEMVKKARELDSAKGKYKDEVATLINSLSKKMPEPK